MRRAFLCALLVASLASCATTTHFTSPTLDLEDQAHYNALLSALKDQCPLRYTAVIVQTPTAEKDDVWGDTWWDARSQVYRIRIDNTQSPREMRRTLIHEWAHAMVWMAPQRSGDERHGPLFGVAWARCYRALLSTYASTNELQPEGCRARLRLRCRVGVEFTQ